MGEGIEEVVEEIPEIGIETEMRRNEETEGEEDVGTAMTTTTEGMTDPEEEIMRSLMMVTTEEGIIDREEVETGEMTKSSSHRVTNSSH